MYCADFSVCSTFRLLRIDKDTKPYRAFDLILFNSNEKNDFKGPFVIIKRKYIFRPPQTRLFNEWENVFVASQHK